MRKTTFVGLLALAALAAVGLVWFGTRQTSAEEPEALQPPSGSRPVAAAVPDESLSTPSTPEPDRERATSSPEAVLPVEEPEPALLAEVSEDELRWIEGRLLLPEGAAWDETAMALSVAAPDRARASRSLFRMFSGEDQGPTRETDVLYRAAFAKDGSFRVACEKDAEWAYLEIDARFLYLPEPQAVKLEGPVTRVDLAPLLGSSLMGKWNPPPDATAVERELSDGLVYMTVISNREIPEVFDLGGDHGPAVFHRTRVDAEGRFEVRGVDPEVDWVLVSHPLRLASAVSDVPDLTPGEETELEVDLVRGTRLSGRVVDRKGAPLFGSRIVASTTDETVDYDRMKLVTRESFARGDGSFDVYGVSPGEVRVIAEREGYRSSVRKKFELEAGAVESGILLKLRRGEALRGRVTWRDGRPAPGATVEVGRDATGKDGGLAIDWRTRYGTSEADATGNFEISGLKRRAASVWAWATREDAGRWMEGVARLDGVKPSEDEEHSLVLEEHLLLTGVVLDGEGHPVPEFTLLIRPDEGAGSMMSAFAAQGRETERSVSSPDGSFRLERLDTGDYSVAVEAEGFATSTPIGFRLPIDPSTPPLEIVLRSFASASGLVLAPDGTPVGGAEVSATRGELRAVDVMLAEVTPPVTVKTNGRGEFALPRLQPGEMELVASSEPWIDSAELPLELLPGETRTGVVLSLRVGATLTGEVLDGEGRPMPDRKVIVRPSNPDRRRMFAGVMSESTTTDANGWFELTGLAPGEVAISASASEIELLQALGDVDDDSEFEIQGGQIEVEAELFDAETTHVVMGGKVESPGDPVAVAGRVTRRGEPVAARVTFWYSESRYGEKGSLADAGEDGSYELELPHPGDYRIEIDPRDRGNTVYYRRVRPVESLELDFALPAGRISGTIFDPEGEPAKEVPVTLRPMGPGGALSQESVLGLFGRMQSDENGHYVFEDLSPGTYVVGAGSSIMSLFMGAAIGYGRTLSDPVRLAPDEDRGAVDIVLGEACTLTGTVTDREGAPINGASIFVFDLAGAPVEMLSATTSNASGRFRNEGLAPGVYTVMARTEELVSSHSEPVEVRKGADAEVELTIVAGTVLVVTVVDEKGVPLRAEIGVTDDRGREVTGLYGFSGFMGDWRMRNDGSAPRRVGPVAPGGYRVTARADGGEPITRDLVVRGGEQELPVELRLGE